MQRCQTKEASCTLLVINISQRTAFFSSLIRKPKWFGIFVCLFCFVLFVCLFNCCDIPALTMRRDLHRMRFHETGRALFWPYGTFSFPDMHCHTYFYVKVHKEAIKYVSGNILIDERKINVILFQMQRTASCGESLLKWMFMWNAGELSIKHTPQPFRSTHSKTLCTVLSTHSIALYIVRSTHSIALYTVRSPHSIALYTVRSTHSTALCTVRSTHSTAFSSVPSTQQLL